MNTSFDLSLIEAYKSRSQIARVLTESWVTANMYCPKCGHEHISHFENNRPVADFYCENCGSIFELKSKRGSFGHSVSDGAYDKMIERITSLQNPDFMFMSYSFPYVSDMNKSVTAPSVRNLLFVPKHFFTPEIIKKRKPLSDTARRAGWTGCNIMYEMIPEQGRIPIIVNGISRDRGDTVRSVQRASLLNRNNIESRGWLFDVLNCVNRIADDEFTLDEVYAFEDELSLLHPDNNNIRAKIRQQLQYLRDAGYIIFLERGHYRHVR